MSIMRVVMNIRDLKYLVALAEHKHFGKAAEACFVSQPGLSMQIKKLEETLGVQLIERNTKNVLLTEIGSLIVEQAHNILERVNFIQEMGRQANDPLSGKLHLGIIPTVAPYLLPHILSELTTTFTKLTIYLTEDTTDHLIEKLVSGKLDLALLALPVAEHGFVETPLFKEEFLLAVSAQHKLAKLKKAKLTDLKENILMLLEDGHCLRDQALSVCYQVNVTETTDFRATSLETLRYMVAANTGITLIPKLACRVDEAIRYLPFSDSTPTRTIGMIWRKSSAKTILFNSVAEQIKKIMKKSSQVIAI